MTVEVEIPGVGIVEFPEGMPLDEIKSRALDIGAGRIKPAKPSARQAEEESMARLATAPPEIPAPPQLSRATRGWVSPETMMMAAGTAGAVLGAPAGPAGVVAGGGLGTAAGSLGYSAAETLYRQLKGLPVPESLKGVGPTREALEQAAIDVGTAGVAPFVGRGIKRTVGRMIGLFTPQARRIADMAEAADVPIGAAHVSPNRAVRGVPGVAGVFPVIGGPLRKGQEAVVAGIDAHSARLLEELAPTAMKGEMSKELVDAAVRRFEKYGNIAGAFYRRFNELADSLSKPNIVPTKPVRDAIIEIQDEIAKERIAGIAKSGADPVGDWLAQFADIGKFGGNITVRQARGIEREINALAQRGRVEGFDTSRLAKVKAALGEAKNNLDLSAVSPEEAQAVKAAWDRANAFFHEAGMRFETPTAKRFGRVDRNIFGKKFFEAGTINRDEVFDAAFNAGSIEALGDLRRLVGPPAFRQAAREYLADAYRAASVPAKEGGEIGRLFSAKKFEQNLRLDTPDGQARLAEMLKGSGTTLQAWLDFIEVAKRGTDIVVRDPSIFVTRRVMLAGAKGLLGAALIGYTTGGQSGAAISIPTSLALMLAGRQGMKFLMNPKNLHDMTRVMLPGAPEALKKSVITRLLVQGWGSEEDLNGRQ